MKIGEKIKILRTGRRMSQKHLSKLIGVSQSSIQAYEVGRTEPKDYIVTAIAKELGLAPDALETDNPEENKLIESTFRDLKFNEACQKINEYYNYTPENGESEPTPVNRKSKPITVYPEDYEPTDDEIISELQDSREEYLSILTGFMNNLNIPGLLKVDHLIAELLKDDRYITTDFYELKKRLSENRNAVVHGLEPESDTDEPGNVIPENESPRDDRESETTKAGNLNDL